MRWHVMTLAALMVMTTSVMASQEQRYQENVTWAQQAADTTRNRAGYKTFTPDDLCSDAACRQAITNPEQARYRNDAAAMDSAKTAAMATDEGAQAVTTHFNAGRPTIDPNDPTWAVAVGIQDQAYNISHGITTKYTDCSGSGKQCATDITHHQCQTLRTEPLTCFESVGLSSYSDHTSSRTYGPAYLRNKTTVTLPALPANSTLVSVTFTDNVYLGVTWPACYNGGNATIYLNVNGSNKAMAVKKWCGEKYYIPYNTVVAVNKKINGSVTLTFPKPIHKITPASVRLTFKQRIVVLRRTNSCAQNPETASCGLSSTRCTEGAGTRIIAGVPVYQSCWKYKKTYQCGQGEVDSCKQYESCKQTESQCSDTVNGSCIKWNKKYTCEVETCSETTLICGEQSYCLDGDCYSPSGTKNDEFNQVASSLAAVSDAAKGLGDPPRIFAGNPLTCTKKLAGFSDCCKDDGWGNDIGLADCSAEDKSLAEAKKKKLTIYLGQYCAKKVLGACLRKKKAYCVFDSKLARIIQQQGKPQLGLTFGSAKHPDCSPITPEQMQQMDFSNIDFSDFYTDLHSNMILPSTGQIQQSIEQAMKEKQQ